MLPVSAYAARYGMPESSVYRGLYTGRIRGERTADGWMVYDDPPPPRGAKAISDTLGDLTAYELALLWLNGSISGDAVVLRSRDGFVPSYFAERFGSALWQRESGAYVCKLSSVSLIRSLRGMGFTGRKDAGLPAPDVDDDALAAALVESRASFVRQLRYDKRYPADKLHAYYVPAVTLCASYPILRAAADAMHRLGILPQRQLYPAANGTSATLKICSQRQLEAMLDTLSACGRNAVFWSDFDRHIHTARRPYCADRRESN